MNISYGHSTIVPIGNDILFLKKTSKIYGLYTKQCFEFVSWGVMYISTQWTVGTGLYTELSPVSLVRKVKVWPPFTTNLRVRGSNNLRWVSHRERRNYAWCQEPDTRRARLSPRLIIQVTTRPACHMGRGVARWHVTQERCQHPTIPRYCILIFNNQPRLLLVSISNISFLSSD